MKDISSKLNTSFGWLLSPDPLDSSWRFWLQALALSGFIFSNSSCDTAGNLSVFLSVDEIESYYGSPDLRLKVFLGQSEWRSCQPHFPATSKVQLYQNRAFWAGYLKFVCICLEQRLQKVVEFLLVDVSYMDFLYCRHDSKLEFGADDDCGLQNKSLKKFSKIIICNKLFARRSFQSFQPGTLRYSNALPLIVLWMWDLPSGIVAFH